MKKRILAYLDYVDKLLERDDADWDTEIKLHLEQIGFFMHERLVHLLVFMLVAVCTVMAILWFVATEVLYLIPLIVMLFVLLIPYCMHYYLLENSVQKMYDQYDRMIEKKLGNGFKA